MLLTYDRRPSFGEEITSRGSVMTQTDHALPPFLPLTPQLHSDYVWNSDWLLLSNMSSWSTFNLLSLLSPFIPHSLFISLLPGAHLSIRVKFDGSSCLKIAPGWVEDRGMEGREWEVMASNHSQSIPLFGETVVGTMGVTMDDCTKLGEYCFVNWPHQTTEVLHG